MNKKKPKISACIITYNHEKFIAEAIEGALMQKVNFDYEIVICDDCSTDKTRDIITKYKKKYPNKIKLYLNEKNLGINRNWAKSLQLCSGEYIAICEGDDFWTDPKKLQIQSDFLDNNPDFALSVHNANIKTNDKIIKPYCGPTHPQIMDLEHILEYGSAGPTCSLVIKGSAIQDLPGWYYKMKGCDWIIQVINAKYGKIKYFDKIMSVYRKHDKGSNFSARKEAQTQGRSDIALPSKNTLKIITNINKYFNYKYDKQLKKQSTYWHHLCVNEYLEKKDIKKAKNYAKQILKELFLLNYWDNSWITRKEFAKLVIVAFLPIFIIKIIKNLNGQRK